VLIEHTAAALAADTSPPAAIAADAGVDEALRISMRQQLFGRHFLVGGHASAGLVRIAVIQLLALAGARIEAGARALTAADLNRGHVLATRAFESGKFDAVLVEHEPRNERSSFTDRSSISTARSVMRTARYAIALIVSCRH
jgi:hypothetical protein